MFSMTWWGSPEPKKFKGCQCNKVLFRRKGVSQAVSGHNRSRNDATLRCLPHWQKEHAHRCSYTTAGHRKFKRVPAGHVLSSTCRRTSCVGPTNQTLRNTYFLTQSVPLDVMEALPSSSVIGNIIFLADDDGGRLRRRCIYSL